MPNDEQTEHRSARGPARSVQTDLPVLPSYDTRRRRARALCIRKTLGRALFDDVSVPHARHVRGARKPWCGQASGYHDRAGRSGGRDHTVTTCCPDVRPFVCRPSTGRRRACASPRVSRGDNGRVYVVPQTLVYETLSFPALLITARERALVTVSDGRRVFRSKKCDPLRAGRHRNVPERQTMAVAVADTPRPAGTRVRRRLRTADRAHRRRERARGSRMRPSLLPATGPWGLSVPHSKRRGEGVWFLASTCFADYLCDFRFF